MLRQVSLGPQKQVFYRGKTFLYSKFSIPGAGPLQKGGQGLSWAIVVSTFGICWELLGLPLRYQGIFWDTLDMSAWPVYRPIGSAKGVGDAIWAHFWILRGQFSQGPDACTSVATVLALCGTTAQQSLIFTRASHSHAKTGFSGTSKAGVLSW